MNRLLVVWLAATFLLVPSCKDPNDPLTNQLVFDWVFYAHANPSVEKANIQNEYQAIQHWENTGIYQGLRASPSFSVRDYLALNPSLAQQFGTDYVAAVKHYVSTGAAQGLRGIRQNSRFAYAAGSDVVIGNEIFQLKSGGAYSGAVNSILLRGTEIVNDHDSGRLVQTALQLDGKGECDNPTEGGTAGEMQRSSSVLLSRGFTDQSLTTRIQAANWYHDGNQDPATCPKGPATVPRVSSTILEKTITAGYGGDPNLIEWKVGVDLAEPHASMSLEGLTGYQKGFLTEFYELNLATGALDPMTANAIGQKPVAVNRNRFPTIVASADGKFAIGAFAEDMYQVDFRSGPSAITARLLPFATAHTYLTTPDPNDKTTKWSYHYQVLNPLVGTYRTRILLAVGTLAEVHARLLRIMRLEEGNQLISLLSGAKGVHAFDAKYYADRYPAIASSQGNDYEHLVSSYLVAGAARGLWGSPDFNAVLYRRYNPDLNAQYGNGSYDNTSWLLWHWLKYGREQGRRGK